VFYKQVRAINDENVRTSWVPEQFAKVGMLLSFKENDHSWSHGWTVTDVWTRVSEEYVREHERDYLAQAEASEKTTPNTGLFK
jgi:hypothetical protein